MKRPLSLLFLSWLLAACGPNVLEPDEDTVCPQCDDWIEPQKPFRIYGNTWYVGTGGLSSILIEAGENLILIDGGLPQSAVIVDANIRAAGFDPLSISAILVSHAHFDHAGGIAALQRLSGAAVFASSAAANALSSGKLQNDDPQFASDPGYANFPAIARVRSINDGEVMTFGDVSIKAVYTPGHSPGGVSWTWQSCALGTCYDIVYADSLAAVSADGYRFSDGPAADRIIASASAIAELDCDILLTPHPFLFGMQAKLERRQDGNPFVNEVACAIYAETALGRLRQRLRAESGLDVPLDFQIGL